MTSINEWNANQYDDKLDFVSALGKGVIELLRPAPGERILDLGCGTGDLTEELAKSGAIATGMDLSENMIASAKIKFPQIDFRTGNAEAFTVDAAYDAVFSNAALHWMKNPERVIACVWNALNGGGRFVAEFGGRGNCETIIDALGEALKEDYGIDAAALNPWYFPSIAQYAKLLEDQGFDVKFALHFDRPTQMKDGEDGLGHWLAGFADDFVKGFTEQQRDALFAKVGSKTRTALFRDGSWHVDYKRLRVMAIKPQDESPVHLRT
ncbi:methyltransferase domain-containing protein [Paenibacillus rhizovicinus]|uniref:Methyltransferase domain-containing protein n=1 Tax=Paenibacillus rhizovicinus TaxID=2704463 RepID=A0A6C0P7D4_9BACL|nr:methyltransferase domain-containing protein [Paenibacillus rhizovicinus]QHW34464.1 methyltransferase domain-containing protein [Paenibacillus rhizovicinus]